MSAEIINLRKARKSKARGEKEKRAGGNRAKFGRTKEERAKAEAEDHLAVRRLDQHRLRSDDDDGEPTA